MEGEEEDSDDPRSICQGLGLEKGFIILVAGAFMNSWRDW